MVFWKAAIQRHPGAFVFNFPDQSEFVSVGMEGNTPYLYYLCDKTKKFREYAFQLVTKGDEIDFYREYLGRFAIEKDIETTYLHLLRIT